MDMKKNSLIYKILFPIACAALLHACIDTVSFTGRKENNYLVVDGKVNLNDSVQTISLTRTDEVGRSGNFPPERGAKVVLLENSQSVASFLETKPGSYQIYNFKPTEGYLYSIDIQLQGGDHYASQPELMPSPVPIDSVYFIFDGNAYFTLFSNIHIPENKKAPYLRWRTQLVYQRSDLYCGALDQVTSCYYQLERKSDSQKLILLDGSELEPGANLAFPITTVLVADTLFGEVTYYTIYQESITPSTFQYWEKVNRLLTQTGSVFDTPPGQIRGNIYNVDDPNAPVLGLFYATAEDYARVKTIPTDFLPLHINPYCGAPGFPPNPFPFPDCCYCKFGIAKPDYWDQ